MARIPSKIPLKQHKKIPSDRLLYTFKRVVKFPVTWCALLLHLQQMYGNIYTYIYIYVWQHIYIHIYIYTHARTRTRALTHTHTHTHTHSPNGCLLLRNLNLWKYILLTLPCVYCSKLRRIKYIIYRLRVKA
jgi:hypothetical protein